MKGGKASRETLAAPLTEYLVDDPGAPCPLRDSSHLCNHGGHANCRSDHERFCHRIAFIDLESTTAGDDWGLINRLLATLERRPADHDRHLLIIDAVEGLETLGGKRDVFGQERERRSRIAQILRTAKNKAHVVFIVEEPREKERLPEEFVSDAVIRLRVERQRDYSRRTIEIEKLRGQAYIRGRHDCLIRRGNGSQTGLQDNPDDRALRMPGAPVTSAYVQVIHSLHYLSREVMELPLPAKALRGGLESKRREHGGDPRAEVMLRQSGGLAGFGIRYLDELIGDQGFTAKCLRGETPPEPGKIKGSHPVGLPWGSITALIGDEGAYKERLGRAFLAQAFLPSDAAPSDTGVALLLTTKPMDADTLASRFLNHHGVAGFNTEDDLRTELRKVLVKQYKALAPEARPIAFNRQVADRVHRLQLELLTSLAEIKSLPPTIRETLPSVVSKARRLQALVKHPHETLTDVQIRLKDVGRKLESASTHFRSVLDSDLGEISRPNTAKAAAALAKVARILKIVEGRLDDLLKPYRLLNEIGTRASKVVEVVEDASESVAPSTPEQHVAAQTTGPRAQEVRQQHAPRGRKKTANAGIAARGPARA